jgi:hypothetical protein
VRREVRKLKDKGGRRPALSTSHDASESHQPRAPWSGSAHLFPGPSHPVRGGEGGRRSKAFLAVSRVLHRDTCRRVTGDPCRETRCSRQGGRRQPSACKTYGVADEPDTLGDTPETATAAYAELATQLVASADSVRERLRFGSIAAAAASATVLERAEDERSS